MIIIEYCAVGEPVSDFDYQTYISDILYNETHWPQYNQHYKVSTSILIEAIRAEIAEGRVDYTKVQFMFNDKIVPVNKYGAIPYWPDGFCDANFLLAERIIQAASTKYRQTKK